MTEASPILQLNNVEAAYGAVKAIRGVSLDVAPGSIVTVLGSNGAGKTTILKTISGILDPQKGSIRFREDKLEGRDPAWIVRQGLVQIGRAHV
jgi:branched-chain amino acid transport system ATP-binding protein